MSQRFAVRVDIAHLPGILDPQGAAIERALPALGFTGVARVTVGKTVQFSIDAVDAETARRDAQRMCEQLLANTVIESYTISIAAADTASTPA